MNLTNLIKDPLLCLFLEETSKPEFTENGVYFELDVTPFDSYKYTKFELSLQLAIDTSDNRPWTLTLRRLEFFEADDEVAWGEDMAVIAHAFLEEVSYKDILTLVKNNEHLLLK